MSSRRSRRLDLAVLEGSEHLRLRAEAHVADLVEKDRPAVGLCELARLLAGRPGEGPLLVAEQLGLDELLGDRGAVDLDEGLRGPGAVLVDRTRDELLARPRLARDEDGRLRRRSERDRVLHATDRGRAPDHREPLLERELEVAVLADETPLLERIADDDQDPVAAQRLLDEVERPQTGGLDRGRDRPVPGHDDHRERRVELLDAGEDLEPVHPGHLDVEDDHVGALAVDPVEGVLA
jgi:hypothetical protein